ncbi:MAG: ornithine carbamoyltransferase [bacterium]|nr:ornithine carbamoyltransferase [bacterium]
MNKKIDFLRLKDFSLIELHKILAKAKELKAGLVRPQPFVGKTMAMVFEKPSTRTRVSFETGFFELGGHPIFLSANDIQIGHGETIEDTARTLSEYVDLIMIRTFAHSKIKKLAQFSTVPVINGLTDLYHPAQVLSDIYTVIEEKGRTDIRFLYIGDGSNNMANSLIDVAEIFGMKMYVASPTDYEPHNSKNIEIVKAKDLAGLVGNMDVIYTDVWTSMGQEDEGGERFKALKEYQVNSLLLENAKDDIIIMHCLPAHRGEEITAEILERHNSIVFKQAGNRLYVQKAIMLYCMGEV